MKKMKIATWFFEGGAVSIPKKMVGLMEPLGLSFKELGEIVYLLYCENTISKDDKYSRNALKSLKAKNLIEISEEDKNIKYTFEPLFEHIEQKLGINDEKDINVYKTHLKKEKENDITYSELIKMLEKELGRFLTINEKTEIQVVVQAYLWPYNLVKKMFTYHQKTFRRQYPFRFFAQMAFGAKVEDEKSLKEFIENLNYVSYKIVEIKRRLGHRNSYSEIEKEAYLKWTNNWKFSHEMVLLAVEQTLSAKDASFKYLDAILENWNKEGINTRELFEESERIRKAKKTSGAKKLSHKSASEAEGKKAIAFEKKRNLNQFVE